MTQTLFLKTTLDPIITAIKAVVDLSSQQDQKWVIGWLRGPELSKQKQSKLNTLVTQLENFESIGTDRENREAIKNLINECEYEIDELIRRLKGNDGKTPDLFKKIEHEPENYYKICNKLGLLDETFTYNDPLSILQKEIIKYFYKRKDQHDKLAGEKKAAAKLTLQALKEAVADKSPASAKKAVMFAIENLKTTNLHLCQENGLPIPVSFVSVMTVVFSQSARDGELYLALSNSQDEIQKLVSKTSDEEMASSTNVIQQRLSSSEALLKSGEIAESEVEKNPPIPQLMASSSLESDNATTAKITTPFGEPTVSDGLRVAGFFDDEQPVLKLDGKLDISDLEFSDEHFDSKEQLDSTIVPPPQRLDDEGDNNPFRDFNNQYTG